MFSGCNFLIFFFRYQGKCKSCATIFFIFAKYNIVYTNWDNMNPQPPEWGLMSPVYLNI